MLSGALLIVPSNGVLSQDTDTDRVWDTGDRVGQGGVVEGGGLLIGPPNVVLSQGTDTDSVWDTGDRVGQEGCVDWGPVNGPL